MKNNTIPIINVTQKMIMCLVTFDHQNIEISNKYTKINKVLHSICTNILVTKIINNSFIYN